jgi:fibronectin-binding autotransporter adhesin
MGIETLQLMKTKLTILAIILSGIFATTAVFGQTTYTWTGLADGVTLDKTNNWTPLGVPSPSIGDTAQWDGVTTSNLVLNYTGTTPSGSGNPGINFILTANQTNSVFLTYFTAGGSSGNYGLNNVTINGPSGAFNLGDPSGTANKAVLNIVPRPNGATHDLVNNSTNPCIIYPNVRFQAGGGAVYTWVFDGTGNWLVTNSMVTANGTGIILAKLGTGTWTWNGPSIAAAAGTATINNPLTIGGGTVILKWATTAIKNTTINNTGTLLEYDAASQAQTLAGAISGTGLLQVNNGTLTLQGQNTYTGNVILSGGELIANATENPGTSGPLGEGNTISFTGGTLGFSVNNTFDYSSRFDTSASQAYSFDTAGHSVTFATGLTSSGGTLTKLGPGTLKLAGANTYTGNTTNTAGRLSFQGTKSGTGNILIADSTALDVADNNAQVTPAQLTVGTRFGATLEFDKIHSTAAAPLFASTLSSAGTVGFNINSGTFTVGQNYPLLGWTSGTPPQVSLGTVVGAVGVLSTNVGGTAIQFTPSRLALIWNGNVDANWTTAVDNNWKLAGVPTTYVDPDDVAFDDTATGTTSLTIATVVNPASVTIYNNTLTYSITSSSGKGIAGSGSFIKGGDSTLTLSGGANTYTGVTTLSGGTVSVGTLANGGSASDIGGAGNGAANLVFNGGTLQYTGTGASIDRLFTLGTFGGTIDSSGSGALNLNNSGSVILSGTGERVFTLTGSTLFNNTFAPVLADNGGGTILTKDGVNTWTLTANNTYSGGTVVNSGTLQIGAGGASGSIGTGDITDDSSLDFNRSGTLTVNGAISGNGSVTNEGGTVILAGNNSYSGGTTINAGTLQIGNGGATGSLDTGSPVANNGLLIFNSTSPITLRGGNAIISGTGNVIVSGTGVVMAAGPNT